MMNGVGDAKRRRISHIVAVGLEGCSQNGNSLMCQGTAQHALGKVDSALTAFDVDGVHVPEKGEGLLDPQLRRPGHEGPDVLGKTSAAESQTGG